MRTTVAAILLAPLALALAGCTSPLTRSAITSNIVQEETHNAYLLLNIARARDRLPMHFTQLDVVRAVPGGFGIGTPALAFEFVNSGLSEGSGNMIKPSLTGSAGVDTVSLCRRTSCAGSPRRSAPRCWPISPSRAGPCPS